VSDEAAGMTIRDWAMSFRELAGAGPDMAQRAAELMKVEIGKAVTQGRSVDGTPLKPKKDGSQPLKNADKAITARGIGNVAVVTLTGVEVFHHFGAGRNPERRILPTKGGMKKLGSAIAVGIVEMCQEFMTRKGRHDRGGRGSKWNPKKAAA
jgi:hypothetical protein